jgi:hypothetical protein
MDMTWTVYGPNWSDTIDCDIDTHPIEVASRVLERRFHTDGLDTELGIIFEIAHSQMKSDSEHMIVLASAVLANAGFHEMATNLEREIDKLSGKTNP